MCETNQQIGGWMMTFCENYEIGSFLLKNFVNLSDDEKEFVRDLRNNPLISKWMYDEKTISKNEHLAFIKKLKNSSSMLYFLIYDIYKNEAIGVIYLKNLDINNRRAYLGIYANIKSDASKKGDNLIMLLKKLAFDLLPLNTLKLEVIASNTKAISLYEKNGFQIEGRLREYVYKNNVYEDVIVMGFLKKENGMTEVS